MPSQVNLEDLGRDEDDEKAPPKTDTRTRARQPSPAATAKAEKELRERILTILGRLSETLSERGDDELSETIAEDAEVIAQALVGMTRPVRAFRKPLTIALAIIEPALAFGRLGRLFLARLTVRRRQPDDIVDGTATEEGEWPYSQPDAGA
jgi:hypothetical protein